MQETWVQSLSWKILWRRERLPTPVFWLGEFYGLGSPWGRKESDTTEQLSASLSNRGKKKKASLSSMPQSITLHPGDVCWTDRKWSSFDFKRKRRPKNSIFKFVFWQIHVTLLISSPALTVFISYKYKSPKECPMFPDSNPEGAGVFTGWVMPLAAKTGTWL